jgi:outer membrane murein-binding lipoprotein Lpp
MQQQVEALKTRVRELEAASARLEVNLAKTTPSEQAAALARQELASEYEDAKAHMTRLETWQRRTCGRDGIRSSPWPISMRHCATQMLTYRRMSTTCWI